MAATAVADWPARTEVQTARGIVETGRKRRASVFIDALAATGSVRAACKAAGCSRATIYRLKAKSQTFEARWRRAKKEACDALEAEAWRRGLEGYVETTVERWSDGRVRTIEKHLHSNQLLMVLLRAHLPEKYGNRLFVEAPDRRKAAEDAAWRRRQQLMLSDPELQRLVSEVDGLNGRIAARFAELEAGAVAGASKVLTVRRADDDDDDD